MTQRVQIILEDDIDGGLATETVTFALDGTSYEIDLNDHNAELFRKTLAGYVAAARRKGRSKKVKGDSQAAEIRKWARENNLAVPDRGRIPKDIYRAYLAA